MGAKVGGRPHLTSRPGGILDLIKGWRTGYLVSPGDVARFGTILFEWSSNPAAYAAVCRSSRETVLARFHRDQMPDRYEAAFRGLFPA